MKVNQNTTFYISHCFLCFLLVSRINPFLIIVGNLPDCAKQAEPDSIWFYVSWIQTVDEVRVPVAQESRCLLRRVYDQWPSPKENNKINTWGSAYNKVDYYEHLATTSQFSLSWKRALMIDINFKTNSVTASITNNEHIFIN